MLLPLKLSLYTAKVLGPRVGIVQIRHPAEQSSQNFQERTMSLSGSKFFAAHIAIAVLLIGFALFQAIERDMHRNLTWGPDADLESMSIAISDMVYGLDRGYVMHKPIFDHFTSRLWKDGLANPDSSQALLRDSAAINRAITDALKLDIAPNAAEWGDFEPLYNRAWRPVFVEDIGRADYYKLAFKLFGFQVESLHYIYFVVLFSATALFCIGLYGNQAALLVLIAYLVGLNVILQSSAFSPGAPSISAYRVISTLAVIPLAHLAFATWSGARLGATAVVALILQACLFIFIVWTRTSVQWGAIAIAAVALLAWWFRRHEQRWHALIPLALVVVGLLGMRSYTQYAAHPAYFTDELLPGHVVWHSAYIGLSLHPEWPRDGLGGDSIPFSASTKYMKATQPDFPFKQGRITNGYYLRIHDQVIRKLYLDFAVANPRYMLELLSFYKPARYLAVYRSFLTSISGIGIAFGLAAILAVATGLAALRWRASEPAGHILVPVGGIALGSLAPSMWAYPAPTVMFDSILSTGIFFGLVAATALSAMLGLFRRRVKVEN
jgi:hypothetical protein